MAGRRARCATALLGRETARHRRGRRRRRAHGRAPLARAARRRVVRALRRVRRVARRRPRPLLAGRPRPAAGRLARGRPRRARLHRQRDGRAARRRRAHRPARRGGRPRRAPPADGLARGLRRRPPARPCASCASPSSSASTSSPRPPPPSRARAPRLRDVAPERVFAELQARDRRRSDPLRGLALMDALGLTAAVLPEFDGAPRRRPEPLPPPRRARPHARGARSAVVDARARPRGRRSAPSTRRRSPRCSPSRWPTSSPAAARCASAPCCTTPPSRRPATDFGDGRVGFPGHDSRRRRRWPATCSAACAPASASAPTSRRSRATTCGSASSCTTCRCAGAPVYRYLRACEPVEADVTLLVGGRPPRHPRAQAPTRRSPAISTSPAQLLGEALDRRAAGTAAPLVRGDELAAELGIRPGPQLGGLLASSPRRATRARSPAARRRSAWRELR